MSFIRVIHAAFFSGKEFYSVQEFITEAGGRREKKEGKPAIL
jgi:hypothetical protein